MIDGEDELTRQAHGGTPVRWPLGERRERRPSTYRYLLDLDSDLAEELDVRLRMAARPAATAVTFELEVGDAGLSEWLAATSPGIGVLVLDGILAGHVRVGDRTSAELLGAGDLIQPPASSPEELVSCEVSWRALVQSRLALLDAGFGERVQPWPQITRALLRRAARRSHALNIQRAICAQPRLELRLALLLWHYGSRWGKVEPGGIRLPVPLTHQLLGRLVGAERPSVSHALSRLAQAGLVTGHGDQWHLHGTLEEQVGSMLEPERSHVRKLIADGSPLR